MKSRKLAVFLVALALPALAAPPSYPLKVRGWQQLRIWAERTNSTGLSKLIVEFHRGSQPAGRGLRPGEGSWLDRGMNAAEPARLEYFISDAQAQQLVDYLHSGANYYIFECYNTGRGYMHVTRAYPKSVRID